MSDYKSKPCPKCGGTDRFYFIRHARVLGGKPAWRCRVCGHMKAHNNEEVREEESEPTYEENKAVYEVYGAIMHYCKDKLEKQYDHYSQFAWDYAINTRHLNEQTINYLNLGYMPKEKKTPTLYHHLRKLGFHANYYNTSLGYE